MTRHEYLEQLRRALRGIDGAEELLAEIDDHFASGAREGRSEAEVASSLGDPRLLGREYRAVAFARHAGGRPGVFTSIRLIAHRLATELPPPVAAVAGGALGLFAGAALIVAGLFALGGLGGATNLVLAPFIAQGASIRLPPLAALFASVGFGLLGVSGCFALLSALVESGRRSGRYLVERVARKGDMPGEGGV